MQHLAINRSVGDRPEDRLAVVENVSAQTSTALTFTCRLNYLHCHCLGDGSLHYVDLVEIGSINVIGVIVDFAMAVIFQKLHSIDLHPLVEDMAAINSISNLHD